MYSFKKRFRASRFYLGEQASTEPVTLNHRRIFILPTGRGLGFATLLFVLMLIAFVYNNNLVYLLSFLLAGIFFISILYCYKSLSGLVVQEGYCKPVFAGENAGFVLYINNPTPVMRTHLGINGQALNNLTVKANSKLPVTVYLKAPNRGWFYPGTITLYSTFPLGLFRSWSPLRFNFRALVYPKPAAEDIAHPDSSPGAVWDKVKAHTPQSSLNNDDFYGLEEYRAGDSIKRIHWKAYAKGQGLLSKQYGGENPLQVWLDFNEAPGGNDEERLSQMCRWVLDAGKTGLSFGFSLPGTQFSPDTGELHALKCLEALALF